jgi:hypothetical protein
MGGNSRESPKEEDYGEDERKIILCSQMLSLQSQVH